MVITSDNSAECSGCTACKEVCPVGAISFSKDREGFNIPIVNGACIKCGRCAEMCPSKNKGFIHEQINLKAYALKHKKENVRYNSASGGFFPAVAHYVIEDLKGYVCGYILDSNIEVKHILTNEYEVVRKMQGSKYVQSDMENCFQEICDLLKRDKYVLFSGTSCQVTGLISLLECKKISKDKLITIDFFCHGVPSPLIWKEFIRFYEKKKRCIVNNFEFRNKKYGWGNKRRGPSYLFTAYSNCITDDSSFEVRLWGKIFGSDLCTRRYCHVCPYATIYKNSDFTMGDFWGIDKVIPKMDDKKGTSIVILHNEKSKDILNNISNDINYVQVSIDDAVAGQKNSFAPSCINKNRKKFWEDYFDKGFEAVVKEHFEYCIINKLKYIVKKILFKLNIRNSF